MSNRPRLRLLFFAVVVLLVSLPAFADVTVTGSVFFSSLDGSALDDDHTTNGIFTVNGNLTVTGTINCNDVDKGSSACPMQFVVTGNVTLAPGSQIFAENRVKDGNGGDITFVVGGNMDIQGTSGATPGALVSSSKLNAGAAYHAGNITISTGGTVTDGAGSILSAASVDATAGTISITSGAQSTIGGYILAGPSRTLTATIYTGAIMTGGGGPIGGNINIKALTSTEPGVAINSTAIVASQSGDVTGGGTITIEGCNVQINGLVASLGKKNPGEHVIVRSGTTITVDGSNLGATGSHLGRIRADATAENAATNTVELYAKDGVTVTGPTSSMYAVTANAAEKGDSGTVSIIATTGTVTASGLALAATSTNKDQAGGTINVSAKGNVTLAVASVNAAGGTSGGARAGGHINVRSYSGAVSWTAGVGDVRPVGSSSGVPTGQQGTIALTYCTTLTTTGTSFPTNGSPVGTFPTTAQTCSPAAPTLPAGNTLPACNTAPVANDDNYTVAEGGTLNVPAPGVLANDTDAEANPLTAILVSGPAHASSFTLNADGSFNYVHDGSETTSDSFTYKANDGSSDSNVATVHITITPVNDAPVANDDNATVAEGGTINMAAPGVLANDTDPDSPTLTAVLISGPSHASSFTLNPNGSYLYVHDGSETTTDSFTYKASDGSLLSNTATVHITITPVNDAPTANNDNYSVAEGGTLNVSAPGVLGNDTDPDSPTLNAVLVSGPAHASSFTLNANGSFSYVHDGSETLSDSFTYKANDGSLDSNVATVNITITAVNDAPVANNDAYSVNEGGTLTVAAPGVLGNDTDADSPTLNAVLVSGPAHASSFSLNPDGSFSYVHDGSETTSDSFTYKANDGSLDSNVATVNITINPVNDAPVANNDAYNVNEGGTLNVAAPGVLGNDTDPDGPTISAILVSGPAHASSFTFNADGSFSYVHDGSETTSDSFTYKANDGLADSNVATVNITINPVNDAPVANNDAYSVNEGGTLNVTAPGVLGNDTDADGPTISAILVSSPLHAASFTLNPDGSFNYVHDGSETTSDSFTYKANDGSADSNVATVTITVTAVNDPPTANDDSYNVDEGGTLNVAAPGVLGNDTDPDGPTISAVLVSGPAHASSFTLNPDGSFSYVHDGSETTSDSFTYKANDSFADSNVATVHITINPINDAPVANNDAYSVDEGGTLNVIAPGVLGNDTDADSPTLTAVLVSSPLHASSFTLNPNGSFNYVHDGSETTSDSFTYRANDGSLNSNVATVTITINPVNDAPVITAGGTLSYTENDPATAIDSTITVSDVDSASLIGATAQITANYVNGQDVLGFTNTANITGSFNAGTGTLTLTGTDTVANYQAALRSVTYTNTSENPSSATRTVSWQVNDGGAVNNLSNVATSTINVTPVNDAPVITAGGTLNYTENQAATAVDNTITVSDVDSATLTSATAQITANYVNGQDILSFSTLGAISGSFNAATGTMTLSGTDTVANYQAALRTIKYQNTSDNPSTAPRTVSWQVNDGAAVSNVATSTINVTAVNDAPVVTAGATLSYTENDPATVIDNTVTVSDADSASIAGATVSITANFSSAQDVLSFATIGPISGSYNGATGVLTLTGTDTVANYQAALRTVKYSNTSENPSTAPRTISWQVNDGIDPSNVATSTVNVIAVNDAPVLANGSTLSYTENDAATVINSVITVSDVDSANLAGATVQITGGYVNGQDVLSFTNAFGITGSFNSATGTLTLSGSSSVANYQAALRTVKYSNTSDDPSTAPRTVSFQVDDGGASNNLSNIVTSTINVTAVNDPPTAFAFTNLPAQAGIPITYPAGKLGGSDLEAGTTITIDTTPINLVNVAQVTLNANGSFTFTPTPGSAGGTASFQYRVSDNGNPPPGANSAYVTVSFAVAGPAIYFVKNPAVGTANCTLNNECTLATALTNIGASTNTYIFLGDANTHTPGATITLNSGGSIIGQGITTPFDTFFGIGTPSQGTLAARPSTSQPFPTVGNTVTLNTNSQARGFNSAPATNTSGIVASGKSGLQVSVGTITTNTPSAATTYGLDISGGSSGTLFNVGAIIASGANANGVRFAATSTSTATFSTIATATGKALDVSSSGATNFTFGNISSTTGAAVSVATTSGNFTFSNVTSTTGTAITTSSTGAGNFSFGTVSTTTGQAVSVTTGSGAFTFTKVSAGTSLSGPTKGISVNGLTGSFTVNGTGGLCDGAHIGASDCTGGTIQRATARGAEFINSNNVTLKNMYFKSNSSTVAGGCIADVASGANSACNGPIFLQTVSGTTNGAALDRIFIDGSSQMGIVANGVVNFSLTNSEVENVGSVVGVQQSALDLQNLSGAGNVISGSHIHDNDWGHNVFITGNTGTATINFTNNTVDNVTVANPSQSDGFQAQAYSSANMTVNVSNTGGTCTFNKLFSNGVTMGANNGSTMNGTLSNCSVTLTSGIFFQGSGTSNMTGTINGNTVTNKVSTDWTGAGNGSNAITIGKSSGASSGTFTGSVTNNIITKAHCGGGCSGIASGGFGNGTTTMTITGNNVQHVDLEGINFLVGQGTVAGTSNNVVTIQSNTVTNPDANNGYAIEVTVGTQVGDHPCVVMNFGDMSVGHTVPANRNTVSNGSTGFSWVVASGTSPAISAIGNYAAGVTGVLKLPNLTGGTNDAAAQAWIVASNTNASSDASNSGVPWVSGSTCP